MKFSWITLLDRLRGSALYALLMIAGLIALVYLHSDIQPTRYGDGHRIYQLAEIKFRWFAVGQLLLGMPYIWVLPRVLLHMYSCIFFAAVLVSVIQTTSYYSAQITGLLQQPVLGYSLGQLLAASLLALIIAAAAYWDFFRQKVQHAAGGAIQQNQS